MKSKIGALVLFVAYTAAWLGMAAELSPAAGTEHPWYAGRFSAACLHGYRIAQFYKNDCRNGVP